MNRGMYKQVKTVFRMLELSVLVVVMISTTGCIGQRIARANLTEGTYAEMESNMPPIPTECGRLFVYVIDGGRDCDLSFCSIDKNVYQILGGAFWWQDLPSGTHKFTVDNICNSWGMGKKKYGLHAVEISLNEGDVKYCRVDKGGAGAAMGGFFSNQGMFGNDGIEWIPVMVERPIAIKEIRELDFLLPNKPVGKIEE